MTITEENKRLLQVINTLLLPGMLSDDSQSKQSILKSLVDYALSNKINNLNEIQNIISKYSQQEQTKLKEIGFYNEVLKQWKEKNNES